MTDKRTNDEIRADVIVSHFLGTETVPTIPDALRLSEQIARALAEAYQRGHDDGWIAGQFDAEGVG